MPVYQDGTFEHTAVQDLLGRPPGWLLRSGIGILTLFVAVILGLSILIRYPDKVVADCVLQTTTPPLPISTSSNGVIDSILVTDGTPVTAGDRLMVLRSTADWLDVDRLAIWVTEAKHAIENQVMPNDPPTNLQLGVLEKNYNVAWSALWSWRSLREHNSLGIELQQRTREINSTEKTLANIGKQQVIFLGEIGLQDQQLKRDSILLAAGAISQLDWEKAKQANLTAQRQYESFQASGLEKEVRIDQLRRERTTLSREHELKLNECENKFWEALRELSADINAYQQNHFVVSPGDGAVSWSEAIHAQTNLQVDATMGFIIPSQEVEDESFVIRAALPAEATGKIEVGQPFYLSLSNYPDQEYGQLEGELVKIAPLLVSQPEQDYAIEIVGTLTNGMTTTYLRELPFTQNSPGELLIITNDRTLLSRVFDNFTNFTQNQ